MGDNGGDHGDCDLIGDVGGDLRGDIGSTRSGGAGGMDVRGDVGGGVDSGDVWGGVDSGGCACCDCSPTSILWAVLRRVAARICLLLLLLVNLSLRRSSSMSVSSEDTAGNSKIKYSNIKIQNFHK